MSFPKKYSHQPWKWRRNSRGRRWCPLKPFPRQRGPVRGLALMVADATPSLRRRMPLAISPWSHKHFLQSGSCTEAGDKMMTTIQHSNTSSDTQNGVNRQLQWSLTCAITLLDKACYESTWNGPLTGRGDGQTVLKDSLNYLLITIQFPGSVTQGREWAGQKL